LSLEAIEVALLRRDLVDAPRALFPVHLGCRFLLDLGE